MRDSNIALAYVSHIINRSCSPAHPYPDYVVDAQPDSSLTSWETGSHVSQTSGRSLRSAGGRRGNSGSASGGRGNSGSARSPSGSHGQSHSHGGGGGTNVEVTFTSSVGTPSGVEPRGIGPPDYSLEPGLDSMASLNGTNALVEIQKGSSFDGGNQTRVEIQIGNGSKGSVGSERDRMALERPSSKGSNGGNNSASIMDPGLNRLNQSSTNPMQTANLTGSSFGQPSSSVCHPENHLFQSISGPTPSHSNPVTPPPLSNSQHVPNPTMSPCLGSASVNSQSYGVSPDTAGAGVAFQDTNAQNPFQMSLGASSNPYESDFDPMSSPEKVVSPEKKPQQTAAQAQGQKAGTQSQGLSGSRTGQNQQGKTASSNQAGPKPRATAPPTAANVENGLVKKFHSPKTSPRTSRNLKENGANLSSSGPSDLVTENLGSSQSQSGAQGENPSGEQPAEEVPVMQMPTSTFEFSDPFEAVFRADSKDSKASKASSKEGATANNENQGKERQQAISANDSVWSKEANHGEGGSPQRQKERAKEAPEAKGPNKPAQDRKSQTRFRRSSTGSIGGEGSLSGSLGGPSRGSVGDGSVGGGRGSGTLGGSTGDGSGRVRSGSGSGSLGGIASQMAKIVAGITTSASKNADNQSKKTVTASDASQSQKSPVPAANTNATANSPNSGDSAGGENSWNSSVTGF